IFDNLFAPIAFLPTPSGIDYQPVSNALAVSVNFDQGEPNNFMLISTNIVVVNGSPVTNVVTNAWTSINGLADEVKITIAKTAGTNHTTSGGFTNGDMFFGTGVDGRIGWLKFDSSTANFSWALLSNDVVGTETHIRGGLHVDDSGSFGGDLIA